MAQNPLYSYYTESNGPPEAPARISQSTSVIANGLLPANTLPSEPFPTPHLLFQPLAHYPPIPPNYHRHHHRPPRTTVPLPPQLDISYDGIAIHPLLAYDSPHVVEYDLTTCPTTFIRLFRLNDVVNEDVFLEPATIPTFRSLTMSIANYPWQVIVHGTGVAGSQSRVNGSRTAGLAMVTVGDVMWALYDELERSVVDVDWGSVMRDEESLLFLESEESTQRNRQSCVQKRVEYLGQRRTFMGISLSEYFGGDLEEMRVHVR